MATFKYVGPFAKSNGKVDVKVKGQSFNDVTPGNPAGGITVADGSLEEKALEEAVNPFAPGPDFLYVKIGA